MVKDDGKAEEPPIIPEPDHPQHIENGPEAHPYPFVVVCFPQAHFQKLLLFNRIDDCFERLRVVHGEVGENLAVKTDVLLGELAHELRVGDAVLTGSGIDSLDPESAECTLLGLTVTIGVGETFLVGVLRYGPDILSGEEITAGSLKNLLAASP